MGSIRKPGRSVEGRSVFLSEYDENPTSYEVVDMQNGQIDFIYFKQYRSLLRMIRALRLVDEFEVYHSNLKLEISAGSKLKCLIPFDQYQGEEWESKLVKDVARALSSITSIYVGHNPEEAMAEILWRLFQCINTDPIELTPHLRVPKPSWKGVFPSKFTILIVCDEWNTKTGGISAFNLQMCRGLVAKGVKVYCVSVKKVPKEDLEVAEKDGVEILDVESKSLPVLIRKLENNLTSTQRSSITHIVGHAHITGEEAKQIRNLRSFSHCTLWQINHIVPKKNEVLKTEGADEEKVKRGREKDKFIRDLNDNADHVFSVGPAMFNDFSTSLKSEKHNLLILPFNPIFLEVKRERTLPIFKNDRILRVLVFGRVDEAFFQKGIDIACLGCSHAKKSLCGIEIRVRGSHEVKCADTRKKILSLPNFHPEVHVDVLPYASQTDIAKDDIKWADVFMMSSRYEAFGLVALEALAANIPILVSNQSGIADFLKEAGLKNDRDFSRFIVSTSAHLPDANEQFILNDIAAWGDALVHLMTKEPEMLSMRVGHLYEAVQQTIQKIGAYELFCRIAEQNIIEKQRKELKFMAL